MAVGGGRQPLVSVSFFLFVLLLLTSTGFLNLSAGGLAVCSVPQTRVIKCEGRYGKIALGAF